MKILAVDSNSIMNRAFYGIKVLTTKDGFFTNAIYGFLSILLTAISETKPDAIVFAFDVHAPTFRHEFYKEYKENKSFDIKKFYKEKITLVLACAGKGSRAKLSYNKIFAKIDGVVRFERVGKSKKQASVYPTEVAEIAE